jgi:hypothetical protein
MAPNSGVESILSFQTSYFCRQSGRSCYVFQKAMTKPRGRLYNRSAIHQLKYVASSKEDDSRVLVGRMHHPKPAIIRAAYGTNTDHN